MTQSPNVNRIAGVATFGGSMPDVPQTSALPAYIAGGTQGAVDFYKAVNDVDVHATPRSTSYDTYYNSDNPAKKVIVSDATDASFNKDLIVEAYNNLFLYTCRQGLTTPIWSNKLTPEDFTLMQRPNLQELDLTRFLVAGADTGSTGETRWYEWVPTDTSYLPALADLTINRGTLSPVFDPNTLAYSVDVDRYVSSIALKSFANLLGATIMINDKPVINGVASRSVSLDAAGMSTDIAIVVTAPDGIQLKYDITVNRKG
jgi:hypothetical protein